MATYTVQAPDGRTLTVEGPPGASQAEVIAQAQRLYAAGQVPEKAETQPMTPLERALPQTTRGPRMIDPMMLTRVPGDLLKVGKETLQAIMSPRQTLETLGGLIESGIEAVNPFMTQEEREASPYRPYGEAFMETMSQKYGTPERASRTFAQEPVGGMMDVSGATALTGAVTRSPSLVRAGIATDPLNLALSAPKAGVAALTPKGTPASMYESAVKFPPVSVPREVRERAVETALRERVMPTYAGIDKINDRLGKLDVEINRVINEADASGKRIRQTELYRELAALRDELRGGVSEFENMQKYQSVMRNLSKMLEKRPDELKPSDVQKFKVKTYRDVNWKKKKQGAKQQTMKALARGARKAIEDVTPEIADINRRYGPLAELRDILTQPAHRISNLNPLSLTTPLTTTAGGVAGGPLGAMLGGALGAMQRPQIMARGALALRGLQERGPLDILTSGSPEGLMIRQGLLQSGRLEDVMR